MDEEAFLSLTLKILKLTYYRNYWTDLNQILHSDRDHQNTLRRWSKQEYNKSKLADGRHLKKSKNGHIYATPWPICKKIGTIVHAGLPKCSFVRSFVCYCEQRSSLLWTSALRPCSGPVRLPRDRKGIGRCVRCVLATRGGRRVKSEWSVVGYFLACPF